MQNTHKKGNLRSKFCHLCNKKENLRSKSCHLCNKKGNLHSKSCKIPIKKVTYIVNFVTYGIKKKTYVVGRLITRFFHYPVPRFQIRNYPGTRVRFRFQKCMGICLNLNLDLLCNIAIISSVLVRFWRSNYQIPLIWGWRHWFVVSTERSDC